MMDIDTFEINLGTNYSLTQPVTQDQVENDVVTSVACGTLSFGANIVEINEDTVVLNCLSVGSVLSVADYLDKDDSVDEYIIDIYNKDPLSGNVETVGDVDTDYLMTNDFDYHTAQFVVTFFVKPEYVMYNAYYIEEDEFENDLTNEALKESKTKKSPLWIAIDGTTAGDGKKAIGEFVVQPHPSRLDTVWVYIRYLLDGRTATEFVAENKTTIERDLAEITNGDIGKKFAEKGFKVSKRVQYADIVSYVKTLISKDIKQLETPHAELVLKNGADVKFLMEMLINNSPMLCAEMETLHEVKRKIKVNFAGKKRIKMQCNKGYRFDAVRRVCVKISGSELAVSRRAKIKAVRTKRSMGLGFKTRTVRKSKRANRFRKLLGLN